MLLYDSNDSMLSL